MKKFLNAQSTLEFIMILILVLAGIVVMGPYVIRSVNAYMRSWEISADQARHSPLVQLNPATSSSCGNGICEPGESNSNCIQDCPSFCGNSFCDVGETDANCPQDCGCPSFHSEGACCAHFSDKGCIWYVEATIVGGTLGYPVSVGCFSSPPCTPTSWCNNNACPCACNEMCGNGACEPVEVNNPSVCPVDCP